MKVRGYIAIVALALLALWLAHDIGWNYGRADGIKWATQQIYGR